MIPLAVPDLTGNESNYLQECITTTFVSSTGPFVNRFEQMVAQAAGSLDAVALSSGTTGLHAALTAVGVGHGDLVVLPAFTFIASANAIAHCGAMPWLVDIDPQRWTLDPTLLAEMLATETETGRQSKQLIHRVTGRRVAAIMPVHTLGLPAAMAPLTELGQQYGLPVIADGAAALGAQLNGQPVGNLGAVLTVFSFNGNKTVTCGGGGAIVGHDRNLIALVRHLTTTARCGEEYDHDRVGFNYRMTNLQAAVGCAQMERLPSLVAAKQRIRQRYDQELSQLPSWQTFPSPADSSSACWFSGGLIDGISPPQMRQLLADLREAGIGARPFWKPMHWQQPYREAPRSEQTVADAVAPRILTLPCSVNLTESEQEYVIEVVRSLLSNR
ncbi:MAG: aminotransferase class I/II-fold pyridoxal phosphate-dependent enzyme [Magnetococcales bacterium]|nr:aminotransferase class I/II-fold pyridoxal phosphate-dependent enzyme [Magnetococcales bacterium]